ncbi:MAG: DMT family transporter [Clostridiaceae bacterium]|nr:DMT family transporter [Clostridiaceae bacterium]
MNSKSFLGLSSALFAIFVWGISFVSTKIILRELPPVTIAFFRQFIALIPLIILMIFKKENFRIKKGELMLFSLSSLFGIVLYFFFENRGLTLISASNASLLVAAVPIFVLIIDAISGRKKINIPSLLCIITSVVGVYFITFEGKVPDFRSGSFLGTLLVLASMISWIIYTFLSSNLGKKYSSLKMTTIQTALSIPLFIPFVSVEFDKWIMPSAVSLLNLIFLGVFCSALAYVFFLFGLKNHGPVLVSALLNLIPVITIIAEAIMLKEMISVYQAAGAALILGSISYLSLKKE